jgi:hypothetical protein
MNDAANAIDKQIKLIPTNNLLCFKSRIAELRKFFIIGIKLGYHLKTNKSRFNVCSYQRYT